MNYTTHHGNNLEILRTLADNSIDAIVTDPPYGLGKEPDALAMLRDWMTSDHHEVKGKGFMGKEWDAFVPQPALWKECLRVLKPGGHLLAFAGTRTQDLMALGLRIAGFEIRDLSAWLYSSGFPKSHNFGCRCSVGTLPNTHEEKVSRKQETKRDVRSLRNSNVSPPLESSEGRRDVLQPSLPKQSTSIEGWKQFPTTEVWRGKSGLEGRSDVLEETRQLQADQIRTVSEGVFADGPQGRIRDGASFDNGANGRQMLNQNGSGASCESQPARQPTGEPGAFPEQHSTQERGMETDKTCPQCGKLRAWQGWGTALKPALEPITVARKPLAGTVAENVQTHGTGALNIDGCRVGGDVIKTRAKDHKASPQSGIGKTGFSGCAESEHTGRWPANVLHDGSDEVVRLFPGEGETSAARFFYCAKASKADRDEGLDEFEVKRTGGMRATQDGSMLTGSGNERITARANIHPTVKPTDLMRYLCRLVTPPGGVVLDPFMGSGSTGKAAMLEGFRFIGIEREAEYVEIANARIKAAYDAAVDSIL